MVGDEQTHIIPAEPDELERIARLSGFADTDSFGEALLAKLQERRNALRSLVREAAGGARIGAADCRDG